jgi:hypothetical protein
VRLLLDEMWTPTIALELRKRDFDVIAISEPAHGQMVNALANFLSSPEGTREPFNRAHYLREAPSKA